MTTGPVRSLISFIHLGIFEHLKSLLFSQGLNSVFRIDYSALNSTEEEREKYRLCLFCLFKKYFILLYYNFMLTSMFVISPKKLAEKGNRKSVIV
jgi:hypothetical protein